MPGFTSGQLKLNYQERGNGFPVVMLHGFGMSAHLCWVANGWLELLSARGFRAIALDSRGHGLSDKPIVASEYAAEVMTRDVINLLDHLDIQRAHFIGHSMGARTAFDIALKYPERLDSLIGVSVGANLFEHVQPTALIAALQGADPADLPPAVVRTVNTLLSVGNKNEALIACLSSPRPVPRPDDLRSIDKPVLVVCGEGDGLVGHPRVVASTLPRAQAIVIPNREHTDVLASSELQELVSAFLADGGRA
ncbi:MAG TPA: alpha/beta hydrolase [Steroidobacter sp.]|uniref:alpha/beta fold hydrolase n=1 Tax=Steroidobacter sp. TaxID=1978227 RepID=UPI002ED96253